MAKQSKGLKAVTLSIPPLICPCNWLQNSIRINILYEEQARSELPLISAQEQKTIRLVDP